MNILLNGESKTIEKDMNVIELIESINLDSSSVIVELNRKILSSEDWNQTVIKENDSIEVLRFVGGG